MSYAKKEADCRQSFEVKDGYGNPEANPQRYRVFRDGFFAASNAADAEIAALRAALIHIQQVACSGSPELQIATKAIAKATGGAQ